MTISKVQIFNIALNILGVSVPVENINLQDNRVILLNNYFELARDYVLKDFDWNFASAFKKLALSENEFEYNKYKYCYIYPNDCVCARNIFNSYDYKIQKFSISSLIDGTKVILTDIEEAVLRYTKRVDKEIFYAPEFSMALSYYLASLVSNVITGSLQKGEMAYEKYKSILKHAKILNASEDSENLYDEATYLDKR